jgi:anion-transporting  ArsA/GET3 family ATPase
MKHRYLLLFSLLPVAVVLVILIPRLKAETSSPKTSPEAMAELFETLKALKLINAVSPTTEQAGPLLAKFNELEKAKMQYRHKHRQAMSRLEQLKHARIDSEAKRTEFQGALNHPQNLETGFIEQRQKIIEEINQILTLEQQVKFKVFIHSYRRDLKKTLQAVIALQDLESKGSLKDLSILSGTER